MTKLNYTTTGAHKLMTPKEESQSVSRFVVGTRQLGCRICIFGEPTTIDLRVYTVDTDRNE